MDDSVEPGGQVSQEPTAGNRAHRCTTCTRSFTRLENLKRHMKTHERILPFSCQVCGRRFSRSDLANKHQSRHIRQGSEGLLISGISIKNNKGPGRIPKYYCNLPRHEEATSASVQTLARYREDIVNQALNQYSHETSHSSETTQLPKKNFEQDGGSKPCDQTFHNELLFVQNGTGMDRDTVCSLDLCVDFSEKSGLLDTALILEDHEVLSQMTTGHKQRNAAKNSPFHGPKTPFDDVCSGSSDAPTCSTGADVTEEAGISPSPHVHMNENELAYAWDPSSENAIQRHAIVLEGNSTLLLNHNTRFDMDETTWCRIKRFLEPPDRVQNDFTLPSLAVANVFIALFFERFYEQSPVLHLPTLKINSLASSLLVVMMAIGAKYSKLQHTRHFAILVLDRSRQNLQYAIETDGNLVRQDQIIYSLSLMCYAGLWSGNKRAYEIAEGARGTLVAYIRRLQTQECNLQNDTPEDYETRWIKWIEVESRRRLLWFAFMIDAQLPALLNTRGIMSLAEVARWACPSDDEFWFAPGARTWKNLLGSAVFPPAPKLAMVSGIIFSQPEHSLDTYTPSMSIPRLNPWSSFLLLIALASRSLEWSHDWTLAVEMALETIGEDDLFTFSAQSMNTHICELMKSRQRLLLASDNWQHIYGSPQPPDLDRQQMGSYFRRASRILHKITKIHLSSSILDIKDALGKGGRAKLNNAMYRFRILSVCGFVSETEQHGSSSVNEGRTAGLSEASAVFRSSIEEIMTIMGDTHLQSTFPYSYMSIFLHHILLWVLTRTSTQDFRRRVNENLEADFNCSMGQSGREFKEAIEFALGTEEIDGEEPKAGVILKHGAKALTGMETWGAALNLALLMQWRSNA